MSTEFFLFLTAGVGDVANDDPGLFIVMMVMLLGFIVAVVAGVVLLLVIAAICCAMVLLGVASVSALASWYHRSIGTGFKVFVQLLFAIVGVVAGLVGGWLLHHFAYPQMPLVLILSLTGLAGALGGVLSARLCLYFLKVMYSKALKIFAKR